MALWAVRGFPIEGHCAGTECFLRLCLGLPGLVAHWNLPQCKREKKASNILPIYLVLVGTDLPTGGAATDFTVRDLPALATVKLSVQIITS